MFTKQKNIDMTEKYDDAIDLLPCPFCGGDVDLWDKGDRQPAWDVHCRNAECYLCDGADWMLHDKDEIIKMWNTRPINKTNQ